MTSIGTGMRIELLKEYWGFLDVLRKIDKDMYGLVQSTMLELESQRRLEKYKIRAIAHGFLHIPEV